MTERCDCCEGKDNGIGDALSFIAQGHWHVTAVMAGTRPDEPPFAYTTGLTSLGKPELIAYGLPQQVGGRIVNTVAERLASGEPIAAGTHLSKVIRDFEVVLIDVDDASDMLETASLYSRFDALQVVFPDRYNVLPWESGYSLAPWSQPLKGAPPA